MDNQNITIEEYIRLEEEKAHRHSKVYSWETAKYDETSFSEYDEVEQNILYFNDLFPFNIIYPDNLKSDKDNDDNEIDIIQSSGGNVNTQGSKKFLEASHDKIDKIFIMESFVMELDVNIMTWNYLNNMMLLNLIKNLYVPFGIPIFIRRIIPEYAISALRTERLNFVIHVEGYIEEIVHDFEDRLETIFGRQVSRVHVLDFEGLTPNMRQDLAERLRMVYTRDDGHEIFMRSVARWGLHIAEEIAEDGFEAYWLGSERVIPDKGDLSDYWIEISYDRDFLRATPSYTYIRDPLRRLHAEGRKSGARLLGGHLIGRLAHHFGLVSDDGLKGLSVMTRELPLIDMGELVKLNICCFSTRTCTLPPPPVGGRNIPYEEEIHRLCQDVKSLCGLVERSMTDQGRFSIWMISCMTQLMEASGCTYQAFDGTFQGSYPVVFERRTRQWTDDASTSTAQQDEQQPDP
ncbi:hypothetical protein Tco_0097684 [Tanacetum coccineum]